ncbi:TetR/AcrR family transcriptional regulator [Streptomyces sp. NPDC127033]|uniref:TetR/AcrR family transcriptional regulator n=1 Tax=Streptomyces sp. NPDC127033 TaxID=3347110 RepID=UPI003666C215
MNADSAPPENRSTGLRDLPVLGQPARERSDAAQNRVRLLDAAATLVRDLGARHVTMEAVASAAQVGKGTLFRRFGDRAGLMLALVDHAEQEYQRRFLSGPPPLGPGAPAAERLAAFGTATIRLNLDHLDLFLAAELSTERRHQVPALTVRLTHVTELLRQAGASGDIEMLAHALLNYLDTALLHHLHAQRGFSRARIEEGWLELAARAMLPAPARAHDERDA